MRRQQLLAPISTAERVCVFGPKYVAVLRYQHREANGLLTIPKKEVPTDGSLELTRRDRLQLISGESTKGSKQGSGDQKKRGEK